MHGSSFLTQAAVLFGAALCIAWLFRIFRAPAIIGFLFAGIVIGPSGLQLIPSEAVEQFSELGLVMLLFTVGLELSPEPLIRSGRRLLVAAGIQIALIGVVAYAVGQFLHYSSSAESLVLAAAVSLASTAIVLNQLSQQGETNSVGGTLVTGILLLQDVFVILLMLFLPLVAAGTGAGWQEATLRGVLSVAMLGVVTMIARWVVPRVLQTILRYGGRELLTLFAVVMAITGAWLAGLAGWSWALGACIAGLILSQTDLRHQLSAEIMPFRYVFNAVFFISMGMLVDLSTIAPQAAMIGAAIVVILIAKCLLTTAAVRLAGWPLRLGIYSGIGLCTVSEFGYVLAREADRLGILSDGHLNQFTALIVGTMMFGAFFFPLAGRLSMAVHQRLAGGTDSEIEVSSHALEMKDHVLIVGFGLNGQNLAKVLKATGIPFIVIEMNSRLAQVARDASNRVLVGDAARHAILDYAGLSSARAMVIAINDQDATRRIVAQARSRRPDLYVLARTRYISELEHLYRLGAHQVIPEEFETSIEIFAHVLKHFGIPDNVIEAQITMIRAGGYGMLRGRPAAGEGRSDLLSLLEATATQTFMLESDSPAASKTIREMDLRANTGVTIIALVRGGRPQTNPSPDTKMEAGDVLVLVGGHKQLDKAKAILSAPLPTLDKPL
ncbi:MAG: cation:proton antiporter [Planctomycetia bacterium]|jgi:CPA2 family monovalent cation:H+ antiporter-2|nr:cation:proton antiporter [Planctomycetia bacterium]MCC7314456.1 cation:proton antiporter [Planctomycetota bacterium]OQZ05382.1 MAG: hypothetical protein B6D36_10415 [Planctomycetes bacterium UTPLA1]